MTVGEKIPVFQPLLGFASNAWRNPRTLDAGLLMVSQYFSAGFGFLTVVVTARIVGPLDYGVIALSFAYPLLLWSFVSAKSISVATLYLSRVRADGRRPLLPAICKLGYAVDLIASLIAVGLVLSTGWWISTYLYSLPNAFGLMVLFSTALPLYSAIGTSRAVLTSMEKFRLLAFIQALDRVSVFIFVMAALWSGSRIYGVVIGTALAHAFNGLASLSIATYELYKANYEPWWKVSIRRASCIRKELISFFSWNYLQTTLTGALEHLPLILLGKLRSPEEAGFFKIASSIATVASYPKLSLGKIAFPIISAMSVKEDINVLRRTLWSWTLRAGVPLSGFVMLTILITPLVISLAFGPQYRRLVPVTQILLSASFISASFFWLSSFFYSTGQAKILALAHIILTVFVFGFAWPCISAWGTLGLAGMLSACNIGLTLSLMILFCKHRAFFSIVHEANIKI